MLLVFAISRGVLPDARYRNDERRNGERKQRTKFTAHSPIDGFSGQPTFAGLVLGDVLVVLVLGVVVAIFGSCSRSCVRLLAVNGQLVGTHSVGLCFQTVFIGGSEVARRVDNGGCDKERRGV